MAAIPSSLNQFTAKWQPMLFARLRSVLDAHAQRDTIVNMTDVFGSFALDFVYLTLFDLDEDFMGRNFEEFKRVRESAEFVFDNMDLTLPTTKRYSTFADFLIDMPLSRRAECEQRGKHWKHLQEHCKLLLQKLREKEVSFDPQDYETNELPFVPTFLQYVAEKEWEEESIVLELAIFVLAGHETTANAMSWMLFEMVRNDGVQEKCRKVVRAPKDSKGRPIGAIPGITDPVRYLRCVIDEVLRLDSIVSRPMPRVPDNNDESMDLTLPGGETVSSQGAGLVVYSYALHNSPANWENPTAFDPDRHLARVNPASKLYYMPFSFGGRSCAGKDLALREMQLVLEVLTEYHFSFEDEKMLTQDRRELQRSSITMRPVDGLRMRVTKLEAPIAPIH